MRKTISFLNLSTWMWILIAAAPLSMPAQAWMKAASAGDNYFLDRQEAEQYYADNPQMVQDVSGGYKIGVNSERIRHAIQNVMVHDSIGVPRFRQMPNEHPDTFHFSFGSSPYTLY